MIIEGGTGSGQRREERKRGERRGERKDKRWREGGKRKEGQELVKEEL